MLAFDKVSDLAQDHLPGQSANSIQHMNLVLADCEEYRRVKRKQKPTGAAAGAPGSTPSQQSIVETEEKRMLGLAIIRGAMVVSCSVEGPPPDDPAARIANSQAGGAPSAMQAGAGISRPAGRGVGIGLQGPAAGVGGSGFPGAGFPGRGGPPPGFPPAGFAPPGFQPPPGGRGFPPPPGGFPGR